MQHLFTARLSGFGSGGDSTRITATHGSFNHIRQVAPMCTPSTRSNLMAKNPTKPQMRTVPWVHTGQHTKRHLDRFSHFAKVKVVQVQATLLLPGIERLN